MTINGKIFYPVIHHHYPENLFLSLSAFIPSTPQTCTIMIPLPRRKWIKIKAAIPITFIPAKMYNIQPAITFGPSTLLSSHGSAAQPDASSGAYLFLLITLLSLSCLHSVLGGNDQFASTYYIPHRKEIVHRRI